MSEELWIIKITIKKHLLNYEIKLHHQIFSEIFRRVIIETISTNNGPVKNMME